MKKVLLIAILLSLSLHAQSFIAKDYTELKALIYQSLKDRIESFHVKAYSIDPYQASDVIESILSSIKCEDPYTYYNYAGYQVSYSWIPGSSELDMEFNIFYRTTKDQEDFVEQRVGEILSSIIKADMSEYERVKAVHDWIVKNLRYDDTLSHYTAYDALKYGTAVCQGYSLLAQKMLDRLGIESKIIESSCGLSAPVSYAEFENSCTGYAPSVQVDIIKSSTVEVLLSMEPKVSEINGDYFVWVETPFGSFWLTPQLSWSMSEYPICVFTGPPAAFSRIPILSIPYSSLPKGTYTFHFSFDMNPNGLLDTPRSEAQATLRVD